MTDNQIIDAILAREAGYVNDPADAGGATNFGITHATLEQWRCEPATNDDVKNLTVEEARAIYTARFIKWPGYDLLSEPLRFIVIDAGVNCGTHMATQILQRAVGAKADGDLGPKTLAAVAAKPIEHVVARFCAAWTRFYGIVIREHPVDAKFAAGWTDRVADHLDEVFL